MKSFTNFRLFCVYMYLIHKYLIVYPQHVFLFLKIQLCLKEFMSLLNVSAISYIRVLYFETTIEDIYFQHCNTITLQATTHSRLYTICTILSLTMCSKSCFIGHYISMLTCQAVAHLMQYYSCTLMKLNHVVLIVCILVDVLKRFRDFLLCTKKKTNCVLFIR